MRATFKATAPLLGSQPVARQQQPGNHIDLKYLLHCMLDTVVVSMVAWRQSKAAWHRTLPTLHERNVLALALLRHMLIVAATAVSVYCLVCEWMWHININPYSLSRGKQWLEDCFEWKISKFFRFSGL